jgi:Zn-dependent M28 family amino/carboxypeptidase
MAAAASAQAPSYDRIANAGAITPGRLRAHIDFLANDLLEGRDTPSRGLNIAAEYIATQLKLWGVKPGGDNGTYFQKIQDRFNATDGTPSYNVIGIIEGADARLKDEYVSLGAHYDHVGLAPNNPTDKVFNGAHDNGSGSAAVLEIAHAAAHARKPKRSYIFHWHAAEEKGLWGSRFFADSPTVPIDKIVAHINMDMIGMSKKPGDTNPRNRDLTGPNAVYVIGSKFLSTDLDSIITSVNRETVKLELDYKFNDLNDPQRLYYRSDHINFARKNIPSVFFFDGINEHYHRVTDEPDVLDYDKFARVTKLIYLVAHRFADRVPRPKMDAPGPGLN